MDPRLAQSKEAKPHAPRVFFEDEALPHIDAPYRAALRLSCNRDDARDLLQETVLRAIAFFRQYAPGYG